MAGIFQVLLAGRGQPPRVAIPLTISTNSYNYDVYTNRGPTYVAGNSDLTVTINPGVAVGSTSTGTYAFLVPSAFNPGDTVTVVNNGVIQGRGGNGGDGGFSTYSGVPPGPFNGNAGSTGGNAVFVNRPTTITNNGTLAGGGGGGGGGAGGFAVQTFDPETLPAYATAGGSGGGGGAGRDGGSGGSGGVSPGGPGTVVAVNGNPGSAGTSPAGGAGGPAATATNSGAPLGPISATGGAGGTGGGRGASGSTGSPSSGTGGGGGSPGAYIVGNPFVTYPATGTRQGPSS